MLSIQNIHVTVENKEVVKGVSFAIKPGEIHVLMGPNGSGKSSLAMAIAGHPAYRLQTPDSRLQLDGVDITDMTPDQRARMGLFLAMQYPVGVEGVSVEQLLRRATQEADKGRSLSTQGPSFPNVPTDVLQFRKHIEKLAKSIGVTKELLHRSLNVGFSGGEKKRLEILQMLVLQPKYAILDETDSGLDIDALRIISLSINRFVHQSRITNHQSPGALVITHYARLLKYLKPNVVHMMRDGRIVESGNQKLAEKIEKEGYEVKS